MNYNIVMGELIGTLLLILLGNGAVATVLLNKSKGQNSGWIVITAGWGFAVAIGVYVSGWITGGHINPAVTLGLAAIGKTPFSLVPSYFLGQLLGAFVGAVLVWLAFYPHFEKTEDTQLKFLCFATRPAIRNPFWNLVCEIIATAVLLIGVLGILNENNFIGRGLGPYIIGILVFSIGLSLGGPTGYAINPARDFSPRLVHAFLPISGKGTSDWKYSWIPIIGPFTGGIIGAIFYKNWIAPLISFLASNV